jgi:hypothetical protein
MSAELRGNDGMWGKMWATAPSAWMEGITLIASASQSVVKLMYLHETNCGENGKSDSDNYPR